MLCVAAAVRAGAQSPHEWAVRAAEKEVGDLAAPTSYLRFHSRTVDKNGDQTRDVIQTRDGAVARLILRDGHALTPAQDAAERSRLQAMLDAPGDFAKHAQNEQKGRKQAVEIVRLIPAAMIFTPVESGADEPGKIVLDFRPDPGWTPPSLSSEVLTGLQGRLSIDAATGHLVRLEANVFRGVNVGFGVFAHLYPGGGVMLEQVQAAENHWFYSHFVEHLTLRALMVKTYKENADVRASDFSVVAGMSYQDAVHLLLNTALPDH